ncbi:hypothetical protein GMLC_02640 [Geomonas limicola]|uniref:HD-GYP domain-containing protein n=1 Tax=Geomonas limicola TaxID=2740186 RepID=A0A6V8N2C0_9BACT|nr:CHASE2 domain-containing protein [Geomonas limicola]GFO66685.1 hypothetical protein GMLC_02640 [Geomonas limicola]
MAARSHSDIPRNSPSTGWRARYPGGKPAALAAGLALTLLLTLVSLVKLSWVDNLDGRFQDHLIRNEQAPAGQQLPVVVALDDATLARYGRWPWPRTRVAELLERIAAQRPASVGIDIIFAEPEGAGAEGDLALERALRSGPFVLGYEMSFDPKERRSNTRQPPQHLSLASLTAPGGADPLSGLWDARGALTSRPEFTRSVARSGFLNASFESEGVLRRMPVLIRQADRVYPSLALATLLRADPALTEPVLSASWLGDVQLRVGARQIPLDERGRLLLRYRGWQGVRQPVSARGLLDGTLAPDTLRGKLVLVGATATGMGETITTPVQTDALLSGVQVHAIAVENLLNGDVARGAPWLFRPLATLVAGTLGSLAGAWIPILAATLLSSLAGLGAWFGAGAIYQAHGLFLSPVLPLCALGGALCAALPVRLFFGERRELGQTRDLAATREFIMTSLSALTEIRDTETGAHILRTQRYLTVLCEELRNAPRYRALLDPETIELLAKLAPLHDIGKVGLPDHLLHKTTPFSAEEYEEVKRHTAYGRDTIARAEERAGMRGDQLLAFAKDLAYSHHDRWDGSGYPQGLKGEEIPWAGRVMAIADTYDALISRRVYKEPIPHQVAVDIIVAGKGSLFDPDVVEAFVRVEPIWWETACKLMDEVCPSEEE